MATMGTYVPSDLSKIVHSIPHVTFQFSELESSAFTLDDPKYLESLAMVALAPVILLLLTMIAFLFYYCCIGVKRVGGSKNNSSACYCSVCVIAIFIMLALGGLCVAAYGSIQLNEGMNMTGEAVSEINESFSTITVQVARIKSVLGTMLGPVETLVLRNDSEQVQQLNRTLHGIANASAHLPSQTWGANDRLEWTIRFIPMIEFYRTIATFSLLGVEAFTCVLGLLGVCCRSKRLLITTTCLGLVCLVLSYIYIGTDLMLDVAVSDLCMDPYDYLKEQAVAKQYINAATADYYFTCHSDPNADTGYLFADVVIDCQRTIASARALTADLLNSTLSADVKTVVAESSSSLQELSGAVDVLAVQLHCNTVHAALRDLVAAVCVHVQEGFFVVALALVCTGFALSAVLCAAPKTWRRYAKPVPSSESDMDLDEVFLPAPSSRPVVSRTNNPLYVPPDHRMDSYNSRDLSGVHRPPSTAGNTLSFFRRSEEDVNLLDQPPPYSPPRPE